jgi:hypothetical protein
MQHKEPGWGEIKGILSIELQYPLREIKVYHVYCFCTYSDRLQAVNWQLATVDAVEPVAFYL